MVESVAILSRKKGGEVAGHKGDDGGWFFRLGMSEGN